MVKIVSAPFMHCHICGKSYDSRHIVWEIEAGRVVNERYGVRCSGCPPVVRVGTIDTGYYPDRECVGT